MIGSYRIFSDFFRLFISYMKEILEEKVKAREQIRKQITKRVS